MHRKKQMKLSFRSYLERELLDRCKKNPFYSLRSFAKYLEIDHSSLSQLIRGKRKITSKMQSRLGEKLGLEPDELTQFDSNIQFSQITLDLFEVTSDWHYFAIMELLRTKNFKPSTAWISKALGLDKAEVEAAVLRLVRIGFLQINDDGSYTDILDENFTTLGLALKNSSHIKMQKQMLSKATDAIHIYPLNQRSQTGVTMAIDRKKLPKAKEMIIKFQRELTTYLTDGELTDVYQLGVSLFPLSSEDLD